MSGVATPPMVSMSAWWDPKDRTFLPDTVSFVPGLLCVDGKSIAFITPTARPFECPLRETKLSKKGFFTTCSFRITCGGTVYRIWLTRAEGARKLSKDQLDGIGKDWLADERDQLEEIEGALDSASSAAGSVSVGLAGFFSIFSFIGNSVLLYSNTRSLIKARRNYKLLRERVRGSSEIQVT